MKVVIPLYIQFFFWGGEITLLVFAIEAFEYPWPEEEATAQADGYVVRLHIEVDEALAFFLTFSLNQYFAELWRGDVHVAEVEIIQ